MRSLYMTRQRKLGKRCNTRYLYQKVWHRGIHGIDQMVSFGEEAGKTDKEEERPDGLISLRRYDESRGYCVTGSERVIVWNSNHMGCIREDGKTNNEITKHFQRPD